MSPSLWKCTQCFLYSSLRWDSDAHRKCLSLKANKNEKSDRGVTFETESSYKCDCCLVFLYHESDSGVESVER